MNVKIRFLVSVLVLIFSINLIHAFDVCGIDYSQPWFEVEDNSGNSVLIIDKDGDIFMRGEDLYSNNIATSSSFSVGSNIFFNNIVSKFASFQSGAIPNLPGFYVQNSQGTNVALLSKSGNIYVNGDVAHEGSQSKCLNDGWLYCNSASPKVKENRDYYCDITGSRIGTCTYKIIASFDCSQNDYTTCSNNNKVRRKYSCSLGGCYKYETQDLGFCTYGCIGNGICNTPPEDPIDDENPISEIIDGNSHNEGSGERDNEGESEGESESEEGGFEGTCGPDDPDCSDGLW